MTLGPAANLPAPVFLCASDGAILAANEALATALQCAADDLLGLDLARFCADPHAIERLMASAKGKPASATTFTSGTASPWPPKRASSA